MKNRPTAFAFLLLLLAHLVNAQTTIPYGNNPQAGHYYNVGDAKIYYELYGKGKPIVLLHGGLFGYIDEYEFLMQPRIVGHGPYLMADIANAVDVTLVDRRELASGALALTYTPKRP